MAIPRRGRALDRNTRMISLWALESPARLVSRKPHDHLHPASGFRAESRCRLAQGEAGQERHAAGVPPVRLCRHRQDHAGAAYRRRRRRRGEIRGLHRQGGARDAQQGLRQRLHHPFADLPGARIGRRTAEFRALGRCAGLEGEADRDRRMLDGRRRDGPRPPVLRMSAAGARRSRAVAADPGRPASSPAASPTRC